MQPSALIEFVRLFNEKHFFEAHEVLETYWRTYREDDRGFYQGLIQAAVLCVHLEKGNRLGAHKLHQTASVYLQPYRPMYQGINLERLLHEIKSAVEKEQTCLNFTPLSFL